MQEDYQEAIRTNHNGRDILNGMISRQLLLIIMATYPQRRNEAVFIWLREAFSEFIHQDDSHINKIINLAQLINGYFDCPGLQSEGTKLRTNRREGEPVLTQIQWK